jgi:hypothetical protein
VKETGSWADQQILVFRIGCITIHEFVCGTRRFSCSGGLGKGSHTGLLYGEDRLDGDAPCCGDLIAVCFLHFVNQTTGDQ